MFDTPPSILPSEAPLPPRPEPRLAAVLRLLRAAVRGEHLDLTQAPVGKALIMLAVPMILEMVMESIFALVDVLWVARLGATAVAIVGLTESMMMIVYALAMGVSIGAMALVARRVGEKELGAAARTAAQGIMLGLLMALVIALAGAIPLAWTLSRHAGMGPSGVFVTLGLCFSIFALISVALFRRGSWKRTLV